MGPKLSVLKQMANIFATLHRVRKERRAFNVKAGGQYIYH